MRSQSPNVIVALEREPFAARSISNPNIENAYALNATKICTPLGNYVTIRLTRHSGRVRLSGRDPESRESLI